MTFNNEIVAGNVLVREAIESENFVAGSAGWQIRADGDAEFNDVVVRGSLHAGDALDYVEVSPTPHPQVEWSTSDPDQVTPATVGFESAGGHSWALNGPDLGAGVDRIEFATSPALNAMTVEYQNSLDIQSPGLDARIGMTQTLVNLTASGGLSIFAPTVKVDGVDQGRGLMDYTNVQASTALAAVEAVGITSGSVDFKAGRAYKIELHYQGSGNTAADAIGFRIRRGSIAGTSLFDTLDTHVLRAASAILSGEASQYVVNNTAATITTVMVGTVYRRAGAGNVQWFANPSNPTWIEIRDVGAATQYPNARPL